MGQNQAIHRNKQASASSAREAGTVGHGRLCGAWEESDFYVDYGTVRRRGLERNFWRARPIVWEASPRSRILHPATVHVPVPFWLAPNWPTQLRPAGQQEAESNKLKCTSRRRAQSNCRIIELVAAKRVRCGDWQAAHIIAAYKYWT